MSDRAFIDTNMAIAYVFFINSLHSKSIFALKLYSELYWSDFVKEEFERRASKKHDNLAKFFHDLEKFFNSPEKELYNPHDLENFAENNYSDKMRIDAKSVVLPFWNKYCGFESQIPFNRIKQLIKMCLTDLNITSTSQKNNLNSIMHITPQRKREYYSIDFRLKSEGVGDEDRTVTLDGHDFACRSSHPVDFVTFDEKCYRGAKNVEKLCFDSIFGRYDDFESS